MLSKPSPQDQEYLARLNRLRIAQRDAEQRIQILLQRVKEEIERRGKPVRIKVN